MDTNFNTGPYFDDYADEKSFYRILFKPGYAVQARELTQMQTILQKQVERFGDHIFKNGSQVIPGSVNVDDQIHFIKLAPFYNGADVATYLLTFRNKIITGVTSGVKYRVIDTSLCDCVTDLKDSATLYCKIEGTAADGSTKRMIPGEDLVALEVDNQIAVNPYIQANQLGDIFAQIRLAGDLGETATTYTNNPSSDVMGYAFLVDVKAGIYYIDGFFVQNPELHLYAGRFDPFPTGRVGFKVVEEIVSSDQDETLLDNALGAYNFSAPGADRFKISVELVKLPLQSTDNIKFIELLRVVNGQIQHKIEKATYSELEKTLARRTYDESGNYEVNKFRMSVREHLDNGDNFGLYPPEPESGPVEGAIYGDINKFALAIDAGKAYIQGYEVEATTSTYLAFNKAREVIENGQVVENGHVVRVDDVPTGMPLGNYTLVRNVYNVPDIENFAPVYLVSKLNSSPGAAPAAADIVGTARVKFIQLHSSDYTGGTATQYKLGLFDIQLRAGFSFDKHVKQIVGTATTTNFSCDLVPVIVTIPGSATSTTNTSIVGVGTNFVETISEGDVLFINGTQIGRVNATPTSNLALTLSSNASAAIAGGTVGIFRSQINEPQYDSLVFRMGYQFIKSIKGWNGVADIIPSTEVVVKRKFTATASSGGVLRVDLTTDNEFFLSDSDLTNYLVYNNVSKLPAEISESSITFDDDANRREVIISGLTPNQSHTLIASVRKVGTAGREKTKTLVSDYALDVITTKKKLTGNIIELRMADVLRIKSVRMTPGNYEAYDEETSIDITDRFTLDNGQRQTYYTNSKLILRPGFQVPSGAIKVTYDYFVASGTGSYFSVDSYANVPYQDVPTYFVTDPTTGNKTELCLTCAIDFRPIIAGDNSWYPELPKRGEDLTSPIAYYVGRIDKVVLDSIGRFNVLTGVPATNPKEPEDPPEGLVLGTVFVPPYTKYISNIKIYQRDNRRYTMKDIGKLDRRISNLEYYVTLNLLEKDTETLQIKDGAGLDKFKNGFIVDQFTGHGIGDVKHPDYRVAVDSQARQLRPMHYTTALDIVEELDTPEARAAANYRKSADLITVPYEETLFVFNPNASRSIDVNPYKIGAFKGELFLMPEGDNWKDTDRRPDLNVTDDNNYDAIRFMAEQLGVTGTQWNEWQTNWTGSSSTSSSFQVTSGRTTSGYVQTVTTDTGTRDRTGILTTLQSSVNSQDYGDRVVDIGFTPFMRGRPVTFICRNLKPNTNFYPFFDNVPIATYVKPADKFRVSRTLGSTITSFNPDQLRNNILADSPARSYNNQFEPAFSDGDIIQNVAHTAVNITAISNLASPAPTFTATVSSAADIRIGHHVFLYNLNFHNAYTDPDGVLTAPASVGITSTTSTSKELNLRKFKVVGISGTTLTLGSLDGSNIAAFSAYDTASYSGANRGKLLRLQATGIVSYSGVVVSADSNSYPTELDIYVVNIKNGFSIGETITGTANIDDTTSKNSVTIDAINDANAESAAPVMKDIGDDVRTDANGDCVGVFYLPNNDVMSFRTGEREFKLIDNQSNSDADFDSKASVLYYSQGITLSKERTIVSSRTASFVQDRLYESIPVRRTSVSNRLVFQRTRGHDPLAQTFTVVSTGGCFVTSVDIFFAEAGLRPIIVELRTCNNGVPSSKIIPFSTSMKQPSEIKTSTNGSVATRFDFQAPVYLQDSETYALVVKTDEPGCQVFISELGQTDILNGNVISVQPLTGSLFLSQNSQEFEINPLLDMKFTLRKAVFDVDSASNVTLKASNPAPMVLELNPFEITPDTNLIRVFAKNHSFVAGDTVQISNVADGNYGTALSTTGIPASVLNGLHTVEADGLEKDSFIIGVNFYDDENNSLIIGTDSDFIKGEYGGAGVTCSRSIFADLMYLKTSDLNFQDTSINYAVDVQDAAGTFTDYMPMVANANYPFTGRKHIKSYDNQTVVTLNPLKKKPSLRLRATIKTTNPNVSPVIDLQKISAYVVANLIDDQNTESLNVDDIDFRDLLTAGDVNSADVKLEGTGLVTSSTSSTTVTGSNPSFFTTEVKPGNILVRRSDGATIGTVATVNSDTSITLTGNAAITIGTPAQFNIIAAPTLTFSNSGGYGIISTNIDTADNLLANATIGKTISIVNAHSNVNGRYAVRKVEVVSDSNTFAGNDELDKINVYVTPPFAGGATIDMITDTDFSIKQLDKYVEDFAPVGSSNLANYITRTLTLVSPAEALKIIFDANILKRTNLAIYYRTWDADIDLNTLPWTDTGFVVDVFNTEDVFTERTIDVENITPFRNVQLKIVMRSSDTTLIPSVKNLRMIAHS